LCDGELKAQAIVLRMFFKSDLNGPPPLRDSAGFQIFLKNIVSTGRRLAQARSER
jgi:hypothetical protein